MLFLNSNVSYSLYNNVRCTCAIVDLFNRHIVANQTTYNTFLKPPVESFCTRLGKITRLALNI